MSGRSLLLSRSVPPTLFVEGRFEAFREARGFAGFRDIASRAGRAGSTALAGVLTLPCPLRVVLTNPAAIRA